MERDGESANCSKHCGDLRAVALCACLRTLHEPMGADGAGAVRLWAVWGGRWADGSMGSFSRLDGSLFLKLKLATDGVASCIKPAFAKALVAFTVSLPVSAVHHGGCNGCGPPSAYLHLFAPVVSDSPRNGRVMHDDGFGNLVESVSIAEGVLNGHPLGEVNASSPGEEPTSLSE